jgi:hypothetical protein
MGRENVELMLLLVTGKSASVSQLPQAKIQHIQHIQQMRHPLKQQQKITCTYLCSF